MFTFAGLFKTIFLAEGSSQKPLPPIVQPVQSLPSAQWLDLEYEAIVTQTIAPGKAGQVKYQGSWWLARCNRAVKLLPGAIVYVVDRRNVTTLYVEPLMLTLPFKVACSTLKPL